MGAQTILNELLRVICLCFALFLSDTLSFVSFITSPNQPHSYEGEHQKKYAKTKMEVMTDIRILLNCFNLGLFCQPQQSVYKCLKYQTFRKPQVPFFFKCVKTLSSI